jgi:hypothetical protein
LSPLANEKAANNASVIVREGKLKRSPSAKSSKNRCAHIWCLIIVVFSCSNSTRRHFKPGAASVSVTDGQFVQDRSLKRTDALNLLNTGFKDLFQVDCD